MPCYEPIQAWQKDSGEIVFSERGALRRALKLPCGRCVGCRLERSRQWAVRCMHEASCHSHNCFLTLTYDDENLPDDMGLHYRHFQLFMKRLRKAKGKVRFYMCGEYGDLNLRPHFHACVFGCWFDDAVLFKGSGDSCLYTSETLSKLWPYGFATIGDVTFESAAYVARYVMKKVTGDQALDHYRRVSPITGEVFNVEPEFSRMSLKPGIGALWFQKYHRDVYPHDYVVVNGREAKPPRYYDKQLAKLDPFEAEALEVGRLERAMRHADDSTPERLAVRRRVAEARLNLKKRN